MILYQLWIVIIAPGISSNSVMFIWFNVFLFVLCRSLISFGKPPQLAVCQKLWQEQRSRHPSQPIHKSHHPDFIWHYGRGVMPHLLIDVDLRVKLFSLVIFQFDINLCLIKNLSPQSLIWPSRKNIQKKIVLNQWTRSYPW